MKNKLKICSKKLKTKKK